MINKRLNQILEMIRPCAVLLDVGTDHGLLPKEALKRGLANKVILADISEGPLSRARHNLGDNHHASFVLSDGLKAIEAEFDCLIVAGMGGDLVAKILKEGLDKLKDKQILVQANTKLDSLRRKVQEMNLHILQEQVIKDGRFYYIVMELELKESIQALSAVELALGVFPQSLSSNEYQYFQHLLAIERSILKAQNSDWSEKLAMIEDILMRSLKP